MRRYAEGLRHRVFRDHLSRSTGEKRKIVVGSVAVPTFREHALQAIQLEEHGVIGTRTARGHVRAGATVCSRHASGFLVGLRGRQEPTNDRCVRHVSSKGDKRSASGRQLNFAGKNHAPATKAHAGPTGPPVFNGSSSSKSSSPRRRKGRARALVGDPTPRSHDLITSARRRFKRGENGRSSLAHDAL